MLGAPWLVATQVQSLPLSSRGLPFCRLSGSSPFVSLMRTHVFGFRAWLRQRWCRLEILTKLLYPDKVTCKTSVGMHLWGASLPLTTVGGELSLSFQAPKDQWVNPPAWLLPSDPVLDLPFLCLYHRGLTLRVPASPQLPAGGHWLKTGGLGEGVAGVSHCRPLCPGQLWCLWQQLHFWLTSPLWFYHLQVTPLGSGAMTSSFPPSSLGD